jgi:hypothetical protein
MHSVVALRRPGLPPGPGLGPGWAQRRGPLVTSVNDFGWGKIDIAMPAAEPPILTYIYQTMAEYTYSYSFCASRNILLVHKDSRRERIRREYTT